MNDDETDGTFSGADRLQLLQLGEGHEWVVSAEADCWNGWHSSPECSRCGVLPVSSLCYHELAYPPGPTEAWLTERGVVVDPAARAACAP